MLPRAGFGASRNSLHLHANAVDISLARIPPSHIAAAAHGTGLDGVGRCRGFVLSIADLRANGQRDRAQTSTRMRRAGRGDGRRALPADRYVLTDPRQRRTCARRKLPEAGSYGSVFDELAGEPPGLDDAGDEGSHRRARGAARSWHGRRCAALSGTRAAARGRQAARAGEGGRRRTLTESPGWPGTEDEEDHR